MWLRLDAHLSRQDALLELIAVQLGADLRGVDPPLAEWTDEWILDIIAANQFRAALQQEEGLTEEEQIERAIYQYNRGGGSLSSPIDPM